MKRIWVAMWGIFIVLLLSACTLRSPARQTGGQGEDERRLPRFVNHTPPEFTVAAGGLDNVSFAALGCKRGGAASDLLGALEPRLALAWCQLAERWDCEAITSAYGYQYRPDGDCLYRSSGEDETFSYGYVVLGQEHTLVATEDDFRTLFAPIESADEALSYVIAVTGLTAAYGLAPEPSLLYSVDTVEDTHVETVEDGYRVNLYHDSVFGCGEHPVSSVVFHITPQGYIEQVRMEPVYRDPERDGWCID